MSDEHEEDEAETKRSRSSHYRANDAGGYGNPPVKGQFRTGNAGGPGRPKGVTNLEAALRKRFATKLSAARDGRSVKMTPHEIFAERVVEAVLTRTTSPAMLEYGISLFKRFGTPEPAKKQTLDWSNFSWDELQLFGGLLARASGAPPNEESPELGPNCDHRVEGYYCVTRQPDGHIVVEKIEIGNSRPALPSS